jgi:hypothetical protein
MSMSLNYLSASIMVLVFFSVMLLISSSSHCLFHFIMTLFRYNIGKKEQQATKAIETTTQLSRRRLACFVRFSLVLEASKTVSAHSL